MAKSKTKHQTSGNEHKICKKSTPFTAKIGKTKNSQVVEKAQQAQSHLRSFNAFIDDNGLDTMCPEKEDLDDCAGSTWSHPLDNCSLDEEDTIEEQPRKAFPYQLQQWALETSNARITLAERLEKSRFKFEIEEN